MSAINKIMPLVLLMFVFIIFATYSTGILSHADDHTNISTEYQEQHAANIDVQNATFSLIMPIGLIFGVLILVIALRQFRKG
jgi:hypothetical protein